MLWIIMLLVVLGLAALRQSQQAKRAGAPPEKTWMARIVMWIVAVGTPVNLLLYSSFALVALAASLRAE